MTPATVLARSAARLRNHLGIEAGRQIRGAGERRRRPGDCPQPTGAPLSQRGSHLEVPGPPHQNSGDDRGGHGHHRKEPSAVSVVAAALSVVVRTATVAASTVLSRVVGSPDRDIETAIAKNPTQPTAATLHHRDLVARVVAVAGGTSLAVVNSDTVDTFRAAVPPAWSPVPEMILCARTEERRVCLASVLRSAPRVSATSTRY